MVEQTIECPECGAKIPLGKAFTQQIEEKIHKNFESKYQKRNQDLSKREKELDERNKSINDEVNKRLKSRITKIQNEEKKKAEEKVGIEIEDIKAQLEEKGNELEESKKAELKLRKRIREVETKEKNIELEIARKVDKGRKKIREDAIKESFEEQNFKIREKEKTIEDLRKRIKDMEKRVDQGSQQLQGEVMELELEDLLKQKFPHDEIEPVPKGMKGADVIQKVKSPSGRIAGQIIWESKRTENWSNKWIDKLKEDQRTAKAEIAAIVTQALPKEMENFGIIDNIWISDFNSFAGLAIVLREYLIQIASIKLAQVDKQDKMSILYEYLTGNQFKQRVEVVVESFLSMRKDLTKEKVSMEKIWAKREKQIERVLTNISGMHGDMLAIAGSSIPEIKGLDLKAITEGKE